MTPERSQALGLIFGKGSLHPPMDDAARRSI